MSKQGAMTSGDAASLLGVSARQVRRLAASGELTVTGRVGSTLLLDALAVNRLALRGLNLGRPWSEQTAWAAIEILETGRSGYLRPEQRSRLRTKLRSMTAEEVVRSTRRRAAISKYRTADSMLPAVRKHLALTGLAAIAGSRKVAARFGLASGGQAVADGYIASRDVESATVAGFLQPDAIGSVVFRTVTLPVVGSRFACDVAVAIDLAESSEPRGRSAGLRHLRDRLGTL